MAGKFGECGILTHNHWLSAASCHSPDSLSLWCTVGFLTASFTSPHIRTHTITTNTFIPVLPYFLPLFYLQGILPFPQLALLTRRHGWVGIGNASTLMPCLYVSVTYIQLQKPTDFYMAIQPCWPSHWDCTADLWPKSLCSAWWAHGVSALSTVNVQDLATKY